MKTLITIFTLVGIITILIIASCTSDNLHFTTDPGGEVVEREAIRIDSDYIFWINGEQVKPRPLDTIKFKNGGMFISPSIDVDSITLR